jgi:hypothetical protein
MGALRPCLLPFGALRVRFLPWSERTAKEAGPDGPLQFRIRSSGGCPWRRQGDTRNQQQPRRP